MDIRSQILLKAIWGMFWPSCYNLHLQIRIILQRKPKFKGVRKNMGILDDLLGKILEVCIY